MSAAPKPQTIGELLDQFGWIPSGRVRLWPTPGSATEADVLAAAEQDAPVCELIDGVLVEKAMGHEESLLAGAVIELLRGFIRRTRLGVVTAPDGGFRLAPGVVLYPDVTFTSGDRLPGRRVSRQPIPDLIPDLAVEVLSVSNSTGEMLRKREEYFRAGVRLVWEIDPRARTASVYTTPDAPDVVLTAADTLTGDPVLPGFALPLSELFAELDETW